MTRLNLSPWISIGDLWSTFLSPGPGSSLAHSHHFWPLGSAKGQGGSGPAPKEGPSFLTFSDSRSYLICVTNYNYLVHTSINMVQVPFVTLRNLTIVQNANCSDPALWSIFSFNGKFRGAKIIGICKGASFSFSSPIVTEDLTTCFFQISVIWAFLSLMCVTWSSCSSLAHVVSSKVFLLIRFCLPFWKCKRKAP